VWTQTVDLHSHSTHSDGQHEVAIVARLMQEAGVKTWALTDHDTTNGWLEGQREARRRGMRFVPGVEITCEPALPPDAAYMAEQGRERASSSWHLLAFFPEHNALHPDAALEGFKAWLAPKQDGRGPRMQAMCARLSELGMPVDVQAVLARASGSVGRPHLAEEMVALGYVTSKSEAFETWIGDGLPAFVPHSKPSIDEAVEAVQKAGGVTSLAHPRYYGVPSEALLDALVLAQVDGVEAVHRSHNDAYRHELMEGAKNRGLGVSVGSDFHGLDHQPRPGNMPVLLDRLFTSLRPE